MQTRRSFPVAAVTLAAATLLAACGQTASGAALNTQSGAAATSVPSTDTSGSSLPLPSPTMAGPTPYADWVARQGFGGSSGLREIAKGAHWLQDNAGASDAGEAAWWWNDTVERLQGWLGTHPPTPCWAELHAHMQRGLADVHASLAVIREKADAGLPRPPDAAQEMVDVADELLALADPPGCA